MSSGKKAQRAACSCMFQKQPVNDALASFESRPRKTYYCPADLTFGMFSTRYSKFKRALTTAGMIVIVVVIIVIIAVAGYLAYTQLAKTTTTTTVGSKITIAMTVSQSGQYAPLDAGYLYLNNAWQNWVDSHGGLVDANGVHHNVTVITTDDSSDVATADQDYHSFAESQGANILVSPYSADTGVTLLPIAQADHVPLIMSEASTRSMWNGTYTWAVTPLVPYWDNDTTNAWAASYFGLLNQTGWAHTIAFVGWNIAWAVDDYTSGVWLAQHTKGLTITSQQLLTPQFTNPDFSSAVQQILSSNGGKSPDIVFCAMFGPFCAQFITQAEGAGLVPKQWHTIEWGASFAGIVNSAGYSTNNMTTDVFWTPSFPASNPGTALYQSITATASKWATGNSSSNAAVTWYNYQNIEIRWEIFQMINASIAKIPTANFSSAATLDSSINNELHSINIQAIAGPLAIQPLGFGTMALVTVQFENGRINTVYPSSVSNATYVHS
jgi:ABC-type branched-subunit amino acid transport system substrate-binding protein